MAFGAGFAAAHSLPVHADTAGTSTATAAQASSDVAASCLMNLDCSGNQVAELIYCIETGSGCPTITYDQLVYFCSSELGCGTHPAMICIMPPGLPPICEDP
jgi:hypothetical protein